MPGLQVSAYPDRGDAGEVRRLLERVELAQSAEAVQGGAMKSRMLLMAGRVLKLAADSEGRPVSGATDAHLAAINALPGTLSPMTASDLFVRECVAINDRPLKNGLKLGASELGQIAAMSPGKGIHRNHDTWTSEGGLPIGRIFAARMEGGEVIQTFYILATDDGVDLAKLIDGGAISEVSVSFMYDELVCSICDKVIEMGWDDPPHPHYPLELYEGETCYWLVSGVNEYLETSLVWQGMANDTRIKMAASRCLSSDSDLAAFLKGKPRTDDLAELMRPVPLDALFAAEKPLETLFTK